MELNHFKFLSRQDKLNEFRVHEELLKYARGKNMESVLGLLLSNSELLNTQFDETVNILELSLIKIICHFA